MADTGRARRSAKESLRAERKALFELLDRFPAQLRLDDLIGRQTHFEAEPGFGDSERVRSPSPSSSASVSPPDRDDS